MSMKDSVQGGKKVKWILIRDGRSHMDIYLLPASLLKCRMCINYFNEGLNFLKTVRARSHTEIDTILALKTRSMSLIFL
jgi:hypothetical protein